MILRTFFVHLLAPAPTVCGNPDLGDALDSLDLKSLLSRTVQAVLEEYPVLNSVCVRVEKEE